MDRNTASTKLLIASALMASLIDAPGNGEKRRRTSKQSYGPKAGRNRTAEGQMRRRKNQIAKASRRTNRQR